MFAVASRGALRTSRESRCVSEKALLSLLVTNCASLSPHYAIPRYHNPFLIIFLNLFASIIPLIKRPPRSSPRTRLWSNCPARATPRLYANGIGEQLISGQSMPEESHSMFSSGCHKLQQLHANGCVSECERVKAAASVHGSCLSRSQPDATPRKSQSRWLRVAGPRCYLFRTSQGCRAC